VVWVERSRYRVTVLHAESFEDLVNVGLLGESDSIVCKVDLDSEEPVNFAEILDVKFRLEGGNKVFSEVIGGSKDRDVVHIDGKKEVAGAVDQDARVVGRESKSVGEEIIREAGVPFPRTLLQSIETPFEFAHFAVYPAAERKTHLDFFF
jgi:hypothetical protein